MSESHNSALSERRLRPVYDALDSGNARGAQHEAEKALRKQPELVCARALLALALLRSGKEREGRVQVQKVVEARPVDESTLQALTIFFKDTGQFDQISLVYSNACAKDPNNEELLSHLFMALVRQGGCYQQQQKVAMQLAKLKPNKTPYFLWATVSIVLQALHSGQNQQVMLTLAERMMEKKRQENFSSGIDESTGGNALNSEQFATLLLLILEKQEKYEEALEVIEGPLGRVLQQRSSNWCLVSLRKLDYVQRLKKWSQLNAVAKTLLRTYPDNWNAWEAYVESVQGLIEENAVDNHSNEENDVERTTDSAFAFMDDIYNGTSGPTRGPFLAKLLLEKSQVSSDNASPQLVSLIGAYIEAIGTKPSCFSDIKNFVREADKIELSSMCAKQLANESVSNPVDIPSIHSHVCYLQLQRLCSRQIKAEEREELIVKLIESFKKARAVVKDIPDTEVRPSDRYVLMAAAVSWDLWMASGEDRHCINAIIMLEEALKESPANHILRFALMKLLNRAGAIHFSLEVYSKLQLKHIQLDTLGHWVTRWLHSCGDFRGFGSMARETLAFFFSAEREIAENLINAYRWGSFEKILEMISLKKRLRKSFNLFFLPIELKLNDLLSEATDHKEALELLETDEEALDIDMDEIQDNRDFEVAMNCEPTSVMDSEAQKKSFEREKRFLRLRHLTLKTLFSIFNMVSEKEEKRRTENFDLSETIQQLKVLIETTEPTVESLDSIAFNGADSSRLEVFLSFGQILTLIFECFRDFNKKLTENIGGDNMASFEKLRQELKSKLEECRKSIFIRDQEKAPVTRLIDRCKAMETFVAFLEICSMAVMVLGVCAQLVVRIAKTLGQTSKKKKKQEPTHIIDLKSELNLTSSVLASVLKQCMEVFQLCRTEVSPSLASLSISEEGEGQDKKMIEINEKLKDSYYQSWSEMTSVASLKLKYLQSLKL